MIPGIIVLTTSLLSAAVLIGGLGRLVLRSLKLEYRGDEHIIAVVSLGILVLSFISGLLCITGLFSPASMKIIFVFVLVQSLYGLKMPKIWKPGASTAIICLLILPAVSYALISPVVEKDLRNIITIQHLVSSGKYTTDYTFLGDFVFVLASASLASVFDWIPAYNFLSGYGWIVALAMLCGAYLLSKQLFDRNTGICAVILVTAFQLYSRTIDYRSSIISLALFLYVAYLTAKWAKAGEGFLKTAQKIGTGKKVLIFALLAIILFTSPFGFAVSAAYLILISIRPSRLVLAGTAIVTALLMGLSFLNILLDYGLFLIGIIGLVMMREDKRINSLYMIPLLLLIFSTIIGPLNLPILYEKYPYDLLKNATIYLIPLSLCLTGAHFLSSTFKKKALYAALLLVLIPHQAWMYESVMRMHVPSREEVHSYNPYPGGTSGSPFILPVQAVYMAFRYKDAYSAGLFPVSIYGYDRTKVLEYLYYNTDRNGLFSDLTPEDRFKEFEAAMKYTGILDAQLTDRQKAAILEGSPSERSRIISEKKVRWLIASGAQTIRLAENNTAGGKAGKPVFSSGDYVIIEMP